MTREHLRVVDGRDLGIYFHFPGNGSKVSDSNIISRFPLFTADESVKEGVPLKKCF